MIPFGRPSKKWRFKEPLDSAMRDVYQNLQKVFLGPYRFFYDDSQSALYLQRHNGQYYESILKIPNSGAIVSKNSISAPGVTLEDVGRD